MFTGGCFSILRFVEMAFIILNRLSSAAFRMSVDVICANNFVVGHGQLDALVGIWVVVNTILRVAALNVVHAIEAALGHAVETTNGGGALEIFVVCARGMFVTRVVMIVSIILMITSILMLVVIVTPGRVVGSDNASI